MIEKGTMVNNRYEVQDLIGSGGTSEVYMVIDRHIGRSLAMKVMDKRAVGALGFARSEIESLRRVKYPLFPAINDAFCENGRICIVSEYVKGESLWKICRKKGLSRDTALALAQRICEALVYLHTLKRPILYLDMKPENIIVDDAHLPHLIDFGIAGWLATRHIPVGTRGYSPPEQYSFRTPPDERADIFAFGMTYYAIRHGVPPDPDAAGALEDIRHSHILSSSERSFLEKCCALSKEDRFENTQAVLGQIRRIRSHPDRIRKITQITAVTTGIILMAAFCSEKLAQRLRENDAAASLVREATGHMADGEYTPEGIGIIKAWINSGSLSEECEQEFIFEVGVYSMLVAKDYKTAASYFDRLDRKIYPEAEDYGKLCRMQAQFSFDADEAISLTGKMFADIAKRSPSREKYENLIFIANCFENYESDKNEGTKKALSVLDMARNEIKEHSSGELEDMKQRIDELIKVKQKRLKIRKKMVGGNNEKKISDK